LISAFNSLTLSPALSALLLRRRTKGQYQALPRLAFVLLGAWAGYLAVTAWLVPWLTSPAGPLGQANAEVPAWVTSLAGLATGVAVGWLLGNPLNRFLGAVFGWFNAGFDRATDWYTRAVGVLLSLSILVLVGYGALLYLTYWSFNQTPTGFIPAQDKG